MKIVFENLRRSTHHLSFTFLANDARFETAYWYEGVDFLDLEKQYGVAFMEQIYFHIMSFEFNKLLSLAPTEIDFGPYQNLVTPAFHQLWVTIAHKVWAQWRYENDLPNYQIPDFKVKEMDVSQPISITEGSVPNLVFCGGGKDSLVSLSILEEQEIPYSVFTYAHSIYGTVQKQHNLIGGLLDHCQPNKIHRQWIYDSFIDSPILQLATDVKVTSLTAAETPSSIFAALPVVLTQGYTRIILGHERSANKGNLVWEKTGEEINHQWGKSFEAEALLNQYIQQNLLANFSYFSLLQPIYDAVIFNLLRKNLKAIPFTHSCNIEKPWCKKCAKCAYVWLGYMAYLPVDLVNSLFGHTNLLDLPENELWFKQMLGMTEHTPFECIGQVEEVRLAFEICKRKGLQGKMMNYFIHHFQLTPNEIKSLIDNYTTVYESAIAYPPALRVKLLKEMNIGHQMAKDYFREHLLI